MHFRILRLAGLAWIACSLNLAPLSVGASESDELESGRINRPARLFRDQQSITLLSRMPLQSRDRIVVDGGGRAEIRANPGFRMALAEHSELFVDHYQAASSKQKTRSMRVELLRGAAHIHASPDPTMQAIKLNLGRLRLDIRNAELVVSRRNDDIACVTRGSFTAFGPASNTGREISQGCIGVEANGTLSPRSDPVLVQEVVSATAFSPVNLRLPEHGWTVVVASIADQAAAEAEAYGLLEEGLPARTLRTNATWRVAIGGFANQQEARAYADEVKKSHGLFEAWVTTY